MVMPPSLLSRLPRWITRWIGYRENSTKGYTDIPLSRPPLWKFRPLEDRNDLTQDEKMYTEYLWPFLGTLCSISLLQGLFGHASYFVDRDVTPIIASFGGSAVLCYGAKIDGDFSQPRALVGGHFISALIGVTITKLFNLLPDQETFDSLRWLAGSLSTATAIIAMQVTKTTHPPAGATALLAAVNKEVYAMSWYYVPIVLLSSMLILTTACIINNVQRQYPTFWFTKHKGCTARIPEQGLGGCAMYLGDRIKLEILQPAVVRD